MQLNKAELLKGVRLVSFESRMSKEMTKLVSGFGGEVLSAPTMQEIPLEKNVDAFAFGEKLLAGRIDLLICLTGVGTRAMFEALETKWTRAEYLGALRKIPVVARGPKPVKVLREYEVPVAIAVQEPNTWRELLSELDENEESIALEAKTIAVQEYGEENEDLIEGLKKRGAHVLRVPVYRWALPDDVAPLKRAIQEIVAGRIDMLLFTNKVQVDHLLQIAEEEGVAEELAKAFRGVLVASVGPLCTHRLVEKGISVDFEPTHPKMGSFVLELANQGLEILKKKRGAGERSGGGILRPRTRPQDDARATTRPQDDARATTRPQDDARATTRPQDDAQAPVQPQDDAALRESRFMKALRREPVDATPVWLMRQAGRYMKEYRDIRRKVSFVDLCKDKDLVTEVTVTAQEFLDADAAIIFSDILLVLEPFGFDLRYAGDEGPIVDGPESAMANVRTVGEEQLRSELGYVFDAIRSTRAALKKNIPLLGFAGAPFTLASYMIEGGASKSFRRTKSFMYKRPAEWRVLLEKISDAVGAHLKLQAEAGVQAVQIFDSWAGCLGPDDYREFAAPYTKRALAVVPAATPVINFATGNPALLPVLVETGGGTIGVDYRISLSDAWKIAGPDRGVQGNLDPLVLYADQKTIRDRARRVLDEAAGRPGHIFNLGHGVLPETPPENAKFLVQIVRELSCKK